MLSVYGTTIEKVSVVLTTPPFLLSKPLTCTPSVSPSLHEPGAAAKVMSPFLLVTTGEVEATSMDGSRNTHVTSPFRTFADTTPCEPALIVAGGTGVIVAQARACPAGPVTPFGPSLPVGPCGPLGPVAPGTPVLPVLPVLPLGPLGPSGPT